MKLCALTLLLACIGCAARTAHETDENGQPARRITRVEIVGNRRIGSKALLGGLATHGPLGLLVKTYETYDPLNAELDRKRIENYYHGHGYFSARVTDVRVKNLGTRDVAVTFVVKEGESTQIAQVDVRVKSDVGTGRISGPQMRKLAGVPVGGRYDHPAYLAGKERLRAALLGRGFAYARVEGQVDVDRDARLARVELDVDPGPLTRFGETRVTGLARIPESAVRARLAWTVGQRFDPALLQLTEGRLYQLGYFSTVRIDYPRRGKPQDARIRVNLAEGSRHEVRLGFGVAVDRARWELRTRAGYVVRSFLQPLLTLRLDARPGYAFLRNTTGTQGLVGEASLELERQDFLAPRLRLDGRGAYRVEEADAYSTIGPEARVILDHPFLLDRLLIGGGYELRYVSFTRLDAAISQASAEEQHALGVDAPYALGAFDESVAYDRRDHPIDPHAGWYTELKLQEAGPYAGGRFSYLKAIPEVRGYLPLGPRLVIAGKARYGRFMGSSGVNDAPITERFYGGGATSVRSFPYRHLAPTVTGTDGHQVAIGGEALFESSLEARLDLFEIRGRYFGTALFFDAGDVTADPSQLQLGHLHYAAGLGLRYDTPIGDVRVDVGFRLNRKGAMEPDPGSWGAIHFTLGEAF